MTTTAAAWRHEREDTGMCADCYDAADDSDHDAEAFCTTPTPDPASPCSQSFVFHGKTLMTCGKTRDQHGAYPDSHQPTRCTCGHTLEAVR